MKKRTFIFPLLATLLLAGCGGGGTSSAPSSTPISSSSQSTSSSSQSGPSSSQSGQSSSEVSSTSVPSTSSSTSTEQEFTGVTFSDLSVSYDGKNHILDEVKGAPAGTTINYQGRENHIDAGSYQASATLSKAGYKTKTLNATLTISKIDFSGLTYSDATVTYNGEDHFKDIQLVGVQPEGTTTKQTVKNAAGTVVTTAVDVGVYSYSVVVSNKNFNTKTLTATLTIKAAKVYTPIFVSGDGSIYFSNGLDHNFLYALNSQSVLSRIDFSSPKEFNKYSSSKALFIAGTPLLNAVKEVSGGKTNIVYTDSNISDFVKYSETVYYYSRNSLTAAKSGIFKVDTSNSSAEPIVTKVFEGKSDNLAINGSYLFFTNGNDNGHVYKMNLTSLATTEVLNDKIHEFTINNNKLYCTVNNSVNDYIGYVDLASAGSSPVKLTNAAGNFLTIKNNKLYFNYTDLYGKIDPSKYGIWSIDLSSSTTTQLLATENINGFDVENSNSFLYVDSENLHLYRYNVSTKAKTDLLDGFVAPEITPLNTGGASYAYGNKVYYLNMYADKTLYVYDEVTKANNQLSTSKVVDFFIYGDKLFFNQVTWGVNNDLYVADLKVGTAAEKINSNDVRNMVSDGTYIYATHYNWAGAAGGLSRMKLDGSGYVKFSEVNGAKNLAIRDGKLYFINCSTAQDNGSIEYIALSEITATSTDLKSTNLSKNIKNVKQFIFENNNIFYLYNGTIDNSVRRTTFSSLDEGTKLASSKTNPSEMILKGGYVYYYSFASTSASSAGFYRVDKAATKDGTQELILGYDSKYYGTALAITSSDNLYFLNYIPKLVLGDAHFYQLNLSKKTVAKIA